MVGDVMPRSDKVDTLELAQTLLKQYVMALSDTDRIRQRTARTLSGTRKSFINSDFWPRLDSKDVRRSKDKVVGSDIGYVNVA